MLPRCPSSHPFYVNQESTHITEIHHAQFTQRTDNLASSFIRNVQLCQRHVRRAEQRILGGRHGGGDDDSEASEEEARPRYAANVETEVEVIEKRCRKVGMCGIWTSQVQDRLGGSGGPAAKGREGNGTSVSSAVMSRNCIPDADCQRRRGTMGGDGGLVTAAWLAVKLEAVCSGSHGAVIS